MKTKRRWCRTVGVLSVAGLLSVGLVDPASGRDADRPTTPWPAQTVPDGRFGVVDPARVTVTLAQAEASARQTARTARGQLCLDHPQTCRLLDEALRTANAIPNALVRAETVADVARAQAEAGMLDAARLTFADAMGIAGSLADSLSGRQTLVQVAVSLAEAGLLHEAREAFSDAVEGTRAITDDSARAFALAPIATAQAEAGLWEDALSTVGDMDESNSQVPLYHIARAQARAELWDDSIATASRMISPRWRPRALADIASVQAASGLQGAARETFTQAVAGANAIVADGDRRSTLYTVARVQAEAGFWEDALEAVNLASNSWDSAGALPTIARVQAETGLWDEALATASAIRSPYARSVALSAIAGVQVRAGLLDVARLTLTDALNAANSITNELARAEALPPIVAAFAEARLWDEALDTAGAITFGDPRSRAMSAVAVALAEAGQLDEARRTFADALTAAGVTDPDALMPDAALMAPFLPVSADFPAVARAQAEAGLWEDALATASRITSRSGRSEALSAIARVQAEAALAMMEPR